MKPLLRRLLDESDGFDLIDAHYFYPDGVAAVMLGEYFGKPVVVTARGSDISICGNYRVPRSLMRRAAAKAAGLVTVCEALKEAMVGLGVPGERIVALRNGVDLSVFQPVDREQVRKQLRLDQFTLLAVGQLVAHKGQSLVIEALALLPGVRLLLAGTGPDRAVLEQLARQLGVYDRVTFLGAVPHTQLRHFYGAADALVLASSREGWANVLLESMACGTPVIASKVWGTPEVVRTREAGLLFEQRSAGAIANAVQALRALAPDRAATRRYAEQFSWAATTTGQINLFERILQARQP